MAGKKKDHGESVSGVVLHSMAGRMSTLPQLVKCTNIPQDKREIITPEMARQFSHLIGIAEEILAYNHKPKVEILICRDAPELLKIRESRNGSKRAPWAQRLDFGWTVSGQMCLDWVGGSAHVSARRTAVCACQIGSKCRNVNIYVQISIYMSRSKTKCRNVNTVEPHYFEVPREMEKSSK